MKFVFSLDGHGGFTCPLCRKPYSYINKMALSTFKPVPSNIKIMVANEFPENPTISHIYQDPRTVLLDYWQLMKKDRITSNIIYKDNMTELVNKFNQHFENSRNKFETLIFHAIICDCPLPNCQRIFLFKSNNCPICKVRLSNNKMTLSNNNKNASSNNNKMTS